MKLSESGFLVWAVAITIGGCAVGALFTMWRHADSFSWGAYLIAFAVLMLWGGMNIWGLVRIAASTGRERARAIDWAKHWRYWALMFGFCADTILTTVVCAIVLFAAAEWSVRVIVKRSERDEEPHVLS